ncbi:hypothetical protein GUITHDRAFT_155556 [Guillardia theta CCMP2712]|uniref:Uncharacterized protein n=1 Tax=Guillardia theta (strain CCMP2712) TaxID=905079 RepID=L1IGV9_GUITC|nr:hypothetical protein GUITHDRAFT_155556 [Guillardia theta CCMP2712]EKX35164.1 hypothetical protein GUITHDRAFT_155556 [Guillardia theta CCMP2712]|eukprot:XP_005822144.1 hypothetical protein GUITHDRAFT_155556 [Guillardia theta CCMP2712]
MATKTAFDDLGPEANKTVDEFMESAAHNFNLSPSATPPKAPADMGPPKDAHEAKERGNACYKARQYAEAVGYYEQAIKMCDDTEQLKIYYSNRSAAYFGLKMFIESRSDAIKCTELDSMWAKGWYRKGLAEEGLEKYHDAEESFRMGVDCAPRDEALQRALQEVKMML